MAENRLGSVRRRKNRISGMTIMLFILMSSVFSVVGMVYLTIQLRTITEDYTQLIEVDSTDLNYMEEIEQLLYQHEATIFRHMATDDADGKKALQNQANEIEVRINEVLLAFGENMKGRSYESYYHRIYSGIGGYFKNIGIIFEFSDQGDIATAEYYMNKALVDCVDSVNESTTILKEITAKEMKDKKEAMSLKLLKIGSTVSLLLFVMFSFGVGAYWLCAKLTNDIVSLDSLTEIPNADQCQEFMSRMARKKKLVRYTCFLLNIKDFNLINRQYGSMVGDLLLRAYAKAIKDLLEKDELVSRQGGDNFVVLIKQERAQRFLEAIDVIPLKVIIADEEREFKLVSRCGIYPIQPRDTVGDVMNCVSMTLSIAKHSHTSDHIWFKKDQYEQILEEKNVLERFKTALLNREFVIYYQPKVDPKTNRLCGAEALVRWVRDGKMVPPGAFIPVLEKEGSIVELDFYVFEQICMDIADWVSKGITPVRISSNFSKMHLHNEKLADDILEIVDRYHVDPQFLEVELTESSGYEDFFMLKKFIDCMREAHIHTSMDDFGTGYSSLSMLKDVEVDVVKLDKSFLKGVDQGDANKEKMIIHLIRMIQDLNRTVVCEGVETDKELSFLRDANCDMIQGYYYDRPLPHDEYQKRLEQPVYQAKEMNS
ncbi:MAG: EAL domain-containing protein [Lachnospiraceae bacterium]